MKLTAIALLAALAAGAQEFKIPASVEKLASKAKEVVEVTLDQQMLALAGRFLNTNKPQEAQAKKLIAGLKGIYVRVFEFDAPGVYSQADVEALRSQLRAPQWSRIVGVRSAKGGENTDVFFKNDKDKIGGIAIVAAEPKELTVVFIDGEIDPQQLSALSGQFGIPKLEGTPRKEAK